MCSAGSNNNSIRLPVYLVLENCFCYNLFLLIMNIIFFKSKSWLP